MNHDEPTERSNEPRAELSSSTLRDPVDPQFEEEAQRAEMEAVLEKTLEDTFPGSDPASTWAGEDATAE
jgi:hypothetical protein